jgi:hypothetical protein
MSFRTAFKRRLIMTSEVKCKIENARLQLQYRELFIFNRVRYIYNGFCKIENKINDAIP